MSSYRSRSTLLSLVVAIGSASGCGPVILIEPDTSSTTGEERNTSDDTASSDEPASSTSGGSTSASADDEDTGAPDPPPAESTSTGDEPDEPGVPVELGDPSPCLLGGNMLAFDGDPGDYIHPGSDVVVAASWTPETIALDELRLGIDPADDAQGSSWYVWFSTKELRAPLELGLYEDAMRVPFEDPGRPGLSIFGDGRGCNTLQGSFVIHDLVIEGEALITLTATWSQHCEGGRDELRGCIHYSS